MCKLCETKEYDWGGLDILCELKGWDRETGQQRCDSLADFILYVKSTDEHLYDECLKYNREGDMGVSPDPHLEAKPIPEGDKCGHCEEPATVVTFFTLKKRACEDCLTEYIPNWKNQIVVNE